jgi:hypothetical protein
MFHFTTRELLLVTLAAALGIGWWLERISTTKHEEWLMRANYHLQRQVMDDGHHVEWHLRDEAGNRGVFIGIDGKRH